MTSACGCFEGTILRVGNEPFRHMNLLTGARPNRIAKPTLYAGFRRAGFLTAKNADA